MSDIENNEYYVQYINKTEEVPIFYIKKEFIKKIKNIK